MENTENHHIPPFSQEQTTEYEIDKLTAVQILEENSKRTIKQQHNYDPIAGTGCSEPRVERTVTLDGNKCCTFNIPQSMVEELDNNPCTTSEQWEKLRIRHDFEYWCATCVTILDKVSGRMVNMVLNRPQQKVLQILEKQRLAKQPLRLILLKARQWGGSTLVQMYMAWIQLVLKGNWNSLICGHLHQTSAAIKGMYNRTLRNYPKHLTHNGEKPTLKTFEGSRNVQQLNTSESLIITGSAQNQDAIRGYDVKMAHLTEVAFWPDTTLHSPEDVIRSISGTIPMEPLTMIVLESTANGVGNYFHNEWLRAKAQQSDKQAVFVPWFEIEIYRQKVADAAQLVSELDNYEKWLWECGCTLEMINWYHHKRREYPTQNLMAAEFPTTDLEAFTSTARNVFSAELIEPLRHTCTTPLMCGDIIAKHEKSMEGIDFVPNDSGLLKIWKMPEKSAYRNRYIVVVDVGGEKDYSDWSVIAVFDRKIDVSDDSPESRPEVVAQWRGHLDHDRVAWKATHIARFYDKALLVFESNTLECEGSMGDLIERQIKASYSNVYHRKNKSGIFQPGFHTNIETKKSAIYNLIAYVRDGAYLEHDKEAVNEMANYELLPNGKSYGARRGSHDDILMTRAIGLQLIEEMRLASGRSRAINPGTFTGKQREITFEPT